MLLRNLDPPRLCNGTRLAVKQLLPHIIEATIKVGKFEGNHLRFAMSINKAQGQSLAVSGINLSTVCFSHGQLTICGLF